MILAASSFETKPAGVTPRLVSAILRGADMDFGHEPSHTPVLLAEVTAFLRPRAFGTYVDATFGGGGHSEALLKASEPTGTLLALDRDEEAIARGKARLQSFGPRLRTAHASFAEIVRCLEREGLSEVDGILADLGLSSFQLGAADRGFSFSQDGPLDMRFDPSSGESAADLVNQLDENELADLLYELGDERRSRAIARRIVSRRPILTTAELRRAVVSVLGPRRGGIDPATRTFQALRIAVNGELEALDALLSQAPGCLAPGGRLAIISYHSLEDRAVKHGFRALAQPKETSSFGVLTKKPVGASRDEVRANPRARSAKLRVLERTS